MKDFAGKVAVVTGAASGMGRAFAQRFAEEAMRVVLADIEQGALDKAVEELRGEGRDVVGVRVDVSDPSSIEALAKRALDAYGQVDLVCNNAGVEGYLDGAIWEATDKDWEWTFGVNFWSVVYGVRSFMPILLDNPNGGHMVNTASMTAVVAAGNMYSITKHGVLALTEVLHSDLKARGAKVGVSALCPGIIATRLFQGSRNRPAALQNEVPTPGAEQGRKMREEMHARLASGMPPAVVAEYVMRGIREERLYILTDHDWDEQIVARHEAIMRAADPELPATPA
jgi:NAD(P)-dependent dehydrogenase (short-subunit alcohol dehydrogenase family)